MGRNYDWRVQYGYGGLGEARSKPFRTEGAALSWAISWVSGEGSDRRPTAFVFHRDDSGEFPDENAPPMAPASHDVAWGSGRVLVRSRPEQTWEERERDMRAVLDQIADEFMPHRSPRLVPDVVAEPVWVPADELPLRIL
jgi:hypothetical protein